ncbi:hypothetical protein EJD88_13580 [Pseudomonas sp. PB105]|uniref:hypothetical protein n=1 Tax=unclassified Pseudomonas TaxID=196821 RepID=UPI00131D22FC|nr:MULTISPECIES: hypothetical protein [unclassified Pseudomonas]KAE9654234.1 hypothetical protein EJD88_13580 [Pseudomonas sp. PB105]MVW94279.1 hypothetical protein [Pseudomonas sp. PB100]
MNTELTEEEMRQALFGVSVPAVSTEADPQPEPVPAVVIPPKATPKKQQKTSKSFTPRLRVTLRVGNEFEGQMHEIIHEADTLSTLVAEQEATKAARKKFRFVEVVSVKSM